MVTICTRLRQAPQVRAIAEAHPGVFWAAGTHPMHAAEEPLAHRRGARRPRRAPEVRRHRRDRPRLPLHRRQRRGAAGRACASTSRPPAATGLPLIIHARDADADIGPHPRRGARRRPLRLRHALLHLRRRAGRDRARPRLLPLDLRHRHLPQRRRACAPSSPPRRATACWSRPTAPTSPRSPHRGKRNEPAYTADTARAMAAHLGLDPAEFAALTSANFDRLFAKAAA